MPATQTKRQKEQQRLDHRKEKEALRQQRKVEKANKAPRQPGDEDPDIAGIVPGPQPIPVEP